MKHSLLFIVSTILFPLSVLGQNSMVGDGFGGRLWYSPSNYTVGSYSAYSICYDICGSGDAELYGWGLNNTSQLGLGVSIPGVNTPTLIPNTTGVKYFSTGYVMGAIKTDNTGWAWGNLIPTPIQVISDVKFLDASSAAISFVKIDGTVWSIGQNIFGNFGDGTTVSSTNIPIQMQTVTNAVRVSNSALTTIVLLSDSTLLSVGSDANFGALGLGPSVTFTDTPLPITGIPKIIDIKSNALGTIALTADGEVYFWGMNMSTLIETNTPILVPSLSNIVAITTCDDGYHYMALDSSKNCYAWGDNNYGQCGVSSTTFAYINNPMLVETDVIDIMAGELFSYILKSNGTLWASGMSGGYSIWLNLSDILRDDFTQLDPSQLPGACELVGINSFNISCNDTTNGSITITNHGGQAPYTYSIGGPFQSSNVFTGLGSGTYAITVQDTNGCQYHSTTILEGINCSTTTPLNPNPTTEYIFFPNVFSPNNDNENETFYFPNEGLTEINCKIFDRWGSLIYEWNNINGFWNGKTSDGKKCSDGTYYYIATYKLNNSELKFKNGYITLIR